MLADLGVEKGDRVVIYMPMVPEAVIAMLACARIGAVRDGSVRRLRRHGAGEPHRRRQAEGNPVQPPAASSRPRGPLQAAARRGDRAVRAQAGSLHHPAAPAARGRAPARPRSRLGKMRDPPRPRWRARRRLRAGQRHRSALHPLHLRHHRQASKGARARHRRRHGGAALDDEERATA